MHYIDAFEQYYEHKKLESYRCHKVFKINMPNKQKYLQN